MLRRNVFAVLIVAATVYCVFTAGPTYAGSTCPSEATLHSISGTQKTQIQFTNTRSDVINIFWLNYNGQRVFYQSLSPGQSQGFDTYATHPWVVTDATGNCLGIWYSDRGSTAVTVN